MQQHALRSGEHSLFLICSKVLPSPLLLAMTNDRSTVDPLYDPPPTPDMTLIEPFKTTDFPSFLGQNIADPDTRPRKRRRFDKTTLHHIIPDVRVFPYFFSNSPSLTPSSHTSYPHPPPTGPETQIYILESRPSNQTKSNCSNRPLLPNSATCTAVWHGSFPFVARP